MQTVVESGITDQMHVVDLVLQDVSIVVTVLTLIYYHLPFVWMFEGI